MTEKEFHKPKECVSDDDECEGKVTMIVNVSDSETVFEETVRVLQL